MIFSSERGYCSESWQEVVEGYIKGTKANGLEMTGENVYKATIKVIKLEDCFDKRHDTALRDAKKMLTKLGMFSKYR